ncbi:MAG: methyltransferase domain-containing protein [Gammaproteobacteria bacterium]
MMDALAEKWDRTYFDSRIGDPSAAQVLTENEFLLPVSGRAMDLACGLGANAIFLAERGLTVTAMDVSGVAVDKLGDYARTQGLPIDALQHKIDESYSPESGFDVIVVSRFLDRSLTDAIIGALNPGGLLFYQTYTREKQTGLGPGNPEYLLAVNELLGLFAPLRVVFYRENGSIGDTLRGLRNEAQYIGRKTILR